jgi:hypothetical protein
MTLDDLIAQVQSNIGRTDKASDIESMLNQCQKGIARKVRVPELESVGLQNLRPGVETHSFDTQWHKVIAIVYTDHGQLTEVLPSDMTKLDSSFLASCGRPEFYSVSGQDVNVYPKADRTYSVKVHYSRWPVALAAGQEPEIQDCDDVLIASATSEMFLRLQLIDEAKLWYSMYAERLADFQRDARQRPGYTPGRVRVPTIGYSGDPVHDPFVRSVR